MCIYIYVCVLFFWFGAWVLSLFFPGNCADVFLQVNCAKRVWVSRSTLLIQRCRRFWFVFPLSTRPEGTLAIVNSMALFGFPAHETSWTVFSIL